MKLFYAFLLTLLPISELRGGLPVAVSYALNNNIPLWLVFTDIVLLNILLIFFVFFFLDKIHALLLRIKIYEKLFNKYILKIQKRVNKIKNHKFGEFFALLLFVSIPLPGTGAWSGCLVAWLLDLDRKKSILAIAGGVVIAGSLILLGSLGLFSII